MKILLKEVAEISAGQGAPQGDNNYSSVGIPFVKAGNLNDLIEGKSIHHIQKVSEDVANKHRLKKYKKGTVLFAKSGMSCLKGYVFVLPIDAYVVNHLACITPTDDIADYLRYYFTFHKPNRLVKDEAYPSISLTDIGNLQINIHNEVDRKRIVKILDLVSQSIAYRKIELDKLDELIKSRFVEMFGDPNLNPYSWEKVKMSDAISTAPQNGLYKPISDYVSDRSGIPILRIDAFYSGKVTDFSSLKRLNCSSAEIKKYLLFENDIVINRVNSIEYLGKCAHIYDLIEDTVFESNMMRFHMDEDRFNATYVTYLLCSDFIYNQILSHAKKAVNQASINQKDVQDFDIFVPPLDIQNQFATFVQHTDKLKVEVQKSLDESQMLFDSLMQKYFS